MKRLLSPACLGLLLLASCARKSPIPPEEVLRRAVSASGQLQSASFDVAADLQLSAPGLKGGGKLALKGVLQDGGNAAQFALAADGAIAQGAQTYNGSVAAQVASDRDHEVFFRLDSLELAPENPLLTKDAIANLLNQWWKLPQKNAGSMVPVSPDPGLLRAQSEVVKVIKDRGVFSLDGQDAFHYDVTLDPEKMAAYLQRVSEEKHQPLDRDSTLEDLQAYDAKGELWIDAESFFVRKIQWSIRPKSGKATPYALTVTASLRDHNAAKPVEYPADAKPWTGLSAVFPTASGSLAPTFQASSATSARP